MGVVDIGSVITNAVDELEPGDRIRVAVFGENSVSVKYGIYTGFGYMGDIAPGVNEVRLFDNGLWMWDRDKWIDITSCPLFTIEILQEHIPEMMKDGHVDYLSDEEIPFCDFSNIFGE